MGIHAAGHPRHRGRLWTIVEGPHGNVHAVPILGRRRGDPGAGGHLTASETGGYGPPRSDKDGSRELDGIICYHRTYRRSAQGTGRVQDIRPHRLSERGEGKGE